MKLQLLVFICVIGILYFFIYPLYLRYRNDFLVKKEHFVDDDDFLPDDTCLVKRTLFYIEISEFFDKVYDTFKDDKKYESDLIEIKDKFINLLTSLLLSDTDTNKKNFYDLTEMETHIRMFQINMYTFFSTNQTLIERDFPVAEKLAVKDNTIIDNILKCKHVLLYGDSNVPTFFGLHDIFKYYILFFVSDNLDFIMGNNLFVDLIGTDLVNKYNQYVLLQGPFSKLDKHIKEIFDKEMESRFANDYILIKSDIDALNNHIKKKLELTDDTYNITVFQGYYHLRNFIEVLKAKEKINNVVNDTAKRLLDYYDKGSNNRKEIFMKIFDKIFKNKTAPGVWDDNNKKYGYDTYASMKRIHENIDYQFIDEKRREAFFKSASFSEEKEFFKFLDNYKTIYNINNSSIEDVVLTPICPNPYDEE